MLSSLLEIGECAARFLAENVSFGGIRPRLSIAGVHVVILMFMVMHVNIVINITT